MKQNTVTVIAINAIMCILLMACKTPQNELQSLKQRPFERLFCNGGWELCGVWGQTEQNMFDSCLIGDITHDAEYKDRYAPRIVFYKGRLHNYRTYRLSSQMQTMEGQFSYNEKNRELILQGCMKQSGFPEKYTVVSICQDSMACHAPINNNKICGIVTPLNFQGEALFIFKHVSEQQAHRWEKASELMRFMLNPSHVKASTFHSVFSKGTWEIKHVFPLYEDSIVGVDELTQEWLGRGPDPYFAWKDGVLYKYERKRKGIDEILISSRQTYDYNEEKGVLTFPHGQYSNKQELLSCNDSLFSTLEIFPTKYVDYYRLGGYKPLRIGKILCI